MSRPKRANLSGRATRYSPFYHAEPPGQATCGVMRPSPMATHHAITSGCPGWRDWSRLRFLARGPADRIEGVPTPFDVESVPHHGACDNSPRDFGRGRSDISGGPALDLPKGPPKILIADDNMQNVELLEAYLSDVDCEIRTAFDGEETLASSRSSRPTCCCST